MKEYVLGIDIGGTSSKLGLVDQSGNIVGETSTPTPVNTSKVHPEVFALQLHKASQELQQTIAEPFKIVGVGMGAPNSNFYRGTIEFSVNLPWKDEIVHLVDHMQRHYPGVPIKLTNDANAATLGEMIYGGAVGMKDFALITLGTGLGSGFVANGMMVYGSDGFAGEFGHITVNPNGRQCGCGRRGCLETYVSATGLKQTAFEVISQHYFTDPSLLKSKSFEDMTPKDITDAALQGDAIAIEVLERTGEILGRSLADVVALFSPEAIFVYGGLAKAGELLLAPARRAMDANVLKSFCPRDDKGNLIQQAKTTLRLSLLNDSNGAVLGAAALAWNELKH